MLYGALALCAIAAGMLVYRYDLYDREPWFMLVLMAGAGALTMWLIGDAEAWTLVRVLRNTSSAAMATVAATHEEFARLMLVVLLALLVPRRFNDPLDGLIYGSMVGLGMAVAESLMRIDALPTTALVLPAAEIVRTLGHLVLGGITGYGVGPARMRQRRWGWILLGCVLAATLWHFLWDWIAFTASSAGMMTTWQTLAGIGLMLTGLVVYGALVVVGSDRSREVFAPASRRRVWGWPLGKSHRPKA